MAAHHGPAAARREADEGGCRSHPRAAAEGRRASPAASNLLWTLARPWRVEGRRRHRRASTIPSRACARTRCGSSKPFLQSDARSNATRGEVISWRTTRRRACGSSSRSTARYLPPTGERRRSSRRFWRRTQTDPWTQTAALSSAQRTAAPSCSAACPPTPTSTEPRRSSRARGDGRGEGGRRGDRPACWTIAGGDETTADATPRCSTGWGRGCGTGKSPLSAWLAKPAEGIRSGRATAPRAVRQRRPRRSTTRSSRPTARVSAANLLAFGPFDLAGPALAEALAPTTPGDVQLAAVTALAAHTDPKVSELFLKNWKGYGPAVRAWCSTRCSPARTACSQLLAAVETKGDRRRGPLARPRFSNSRRTRTPTVKARRPTRCSGRRSTPTARRS